LPAISAKLASSLLSSIHAYHTWLGSYAFDTGPTFHTAMPITPELYNAQIDNEDIQVDAWADTPLLQSLEEGGVDWPSSCRNGTCRTCVGRLKSGSVHYEIEWPGLSAEDKEAGCVLPCVAYPDGNVVLLRGEY